MIRRVPAVARIVSYAPLFMAAVLLHAQTSPGVRPGVPGAGGPISGLTTKEGKFFSAGLDLGLSSDPYESFQLFQGLIRAEYESVVSEFGLVRMDATESLIHQQQRMREIVRPYLEGAMRQPSPPPEDPLRVAGLLGHRQAEHTGALGAGG